MNFSTTITLAVSRQPSQTSAPLLIIRPAAPLMRFPYTQTHRDNFTCTADRCDVGHTVGTTDFAANFVRSSVWEPDRPTGPETKRFQQQQQQKLNRRRVKTKRRCWLADSRDYMRIRQEHLAGDGSINVLSGVLVGFSGCRWRGLMFVADSYFCKRN